jgi:hypothetical protein
MVRECRQAHIFSDLTKRVEKCFPDVHNSRAVQRLCETAFEKK